MDEQNNKLGSKKTTLLVGNDKKSSIEPDERFFIDEPSTEFNEPSPVEKIFNSELKKKIKNEEKKIKNAVLRNKFMNLFTNSNRIKSIASYMDFSLNIFSIIVIILGVVYTLNYIYCEKPIMALVGCLFIIVSIYLNEKIN